MKTVVLINIGGHTKLEQSYNVNIYRKQIREGSQIVSDESASMSRVEYPTKGFSHVVSGVDNSRNKSHLNRACLLPILNSKVLDINMTGALSRNTSIDHCIFGKLLLLLFNRSRCIFLLSSPQCPFSLSLL